MLFAAADAPFLEGCMQRRNGDTCHCSGIEICFSRYTCYENLDVRSSPWSEFNGIECELRLDGTSGVKTGLSTPVTADPVDGLGLEDGSSFRRNLGLLFSLTLKLVLLL